MPCKNIIRKQSRSLGGELLLKQSKGVSLIEVLVALVILASGIVVLVKFQGDLLRSRGMINQQSQAMMLARDKMNELRHYSVMNTTSGYTAYADITSGGETTTGDNTVYTLSWTVTTVLSPPHKVIRVTVNWNDPKGEAQTITMDGMVASIDPVESGAVMQGF